ncbi:MAG: alpha-L-fucosidase [Candidatus Sulfotelmatobacter sp.]
MDAIFHRIATVCAIVTLCATFSFAQNFADVKPSPQQVAWQDFEIGAIIHFGPNTFMDREWGDGTADPSVFNPTHLDPEQWMQAAKSAGIKYVVFVAKHHDGFCLWPTAVSQYSIKSSPWEEGHGDLVQDVATAARKYGLKFGIYLSPWDRHEPTYKDSTAYDGYYLAQLNELVTRYGELVEFWLDGAGSAGHVYDFDRYVDNLRVYQPNTLIFADAALLKYGDIRWVGNENGTAPQENWNVLDLRGYLRYRSAEADTPLRKSHWFWHPNDENSLKSVSELLDTYNQTVGRGAQLMIGLAPDNRGLLPDADVRRLKEFGEAVGSIYAPEKNLAARATNASAFRGAVDSDPDTMWSAPEGSRSAVIDLLFAQPIRFDRTLTMEWLVDGQKVQKYAIQVMDGAKWKTIYSGTTIGHKKIDLFPRVSAQHIRLNILSSSGTPRIREFQLFEGSLDGRQDLVRGALTPARRN